MDEKPLSYYAHTIRPLLPATAFQPVKSRLLWLALHVVTIAGGTFALTRHVGGWWAAPLWSLLIGQAFGGCAFVGHETMHGAVIRNRRLRHAIGWLCFLPFSLSPTLWVAWHNKVHHGHTGQDGTDPDAFPTLADYRDSKALRVADYFAVGHGRWFGFLTLLVGFTGQSTQMLLRWSRRTDALDAGQRRVVALEAFSALVFWSTVLWLVGPAVFVFCFIIPLLIGNTVVMSYILTNHSLSPLTDVNDPLLNSLSVEVPELLHRMHLHFGLHVEHHVFPAMSSAHAHLVRAALREKFPDRYQSLPLLAALRRLSETPRVYASRTRLVDPLSGLEADTLLPAA